MTRMNKSTYENKLARETWEAFFDTFSDDNTLTPAEKLDIAIDEFITYKLANYEDINDFGAIGDIIELMTVKFLRKKGFRVRDVHIKASGKVDFTFSNGQTVEIGHNGKSFNFANKIDETVYTDVDFIGTDFFVYGCIPEKWSVDEIPDYMHIFTKDEAYTMFENVKKGGIKSALHPTKKGFSLTIRYNEFFAKDFENYCFENDIPSIRQYKEENS